MIVIRLPAPIYGKKNVSASEEPSAKLISASTYCEGSFYLEPLDSEELDYVFLFVTLPSNPVDLCVGELAESDCDNLSSGGISFVSMRENELCYP